MAEPLKNLYNRERLEEIADLLISVYPDFNRDSFLSLLNKKEWPDLELKDRMHCIAHELYNHLKGSYKERIALLYPVASQGEGFLNMIYPDIVEMYGLDEYETSVSALEHFTKYSSSEFAVRPFLINYPQMISQMEKWSLSENEHVRRLASEGCRPRLPWAIALPEFKKDPSPILSILENLQDDESEYVRRSVANNLNDISKDNPEITIEIANRWYGQTKEKDALIKHACRTLLKAGDPRILPLFGYEDPDHISIIKLSFPETIDWEGHLPITFTLQSTENPGLVRIELALYFLRKNGSYSRKVFKVSESQIKKRSVAISSGFSFKKITTRRYYSGAQEFAIVLNGREMERHQFVLKEES